MIEGVKVLDRRLIERLFEEAKKNPRRRASYCFHNFNSDGVTSSEKIQRVLNAIMADSFVSPHRHVNPPKKEIFIGLAGRLVAVCYDEEGEVIEFFPFGRDEEILVVEMNPLVWHSMVAMTPRAAMLEIIEGPYDPEHHMEKAAWAPPEDDREACQEFLRNLKEKMKSFD